MYFAPNMYFHPHYANGGPFLNYGNAPYQGIDDMGQSYPLGRPTKDRLSRDHGNRPFVINIHKAASRNRTFRTAIWTGNHLQVTLMSIGVGEDIGLEMHPHVDQFLRIEQGQGIVQIGNTQTNLSFVRRVFDDDAIFVPAGKWHNVINIGHTPLKLYSIYAPPEHPFGTVHVTKADAIAAEHS
ncbi:cupin domain-containing protein [Bacillaceae bacterium YX66]